MGTGLAVNTGHRRQLRAFSVAACYDLVFEK